MDQRCLKTSTAKHKLSTGGPHSVHILTHILIFSFQNQVNWHNGHFLFPCSWRSSKRSGWSCLQLLPSKPGSYAHSRTWRQNLNSNKPKEESSLMVCLTTYQTAGAFIHTKCYLMKLESYLFFCFSFRRGRGGNSGSSGSLWTAGSRGDSGQDAQRLLWENSKII